MIFRIFSAFIVSRFIIYFFAYLWTNGNQKITELFCKFDCNWYLSIANEGYFDYPKAHLDGNAANWAFLPIFPKTVYLFSKIFNITALDSAYIVNNFAFFIGLIYLFKYIEHKFNKEIAFNTILFMTFNPYSIYFAIPYTESFYFLFLILVFYLISQKKWLAAGVVASFLSATRIVGVVVIVVMIIFAIEEIGIKNLIKLNKEYSQKILFSIILAPLGLSLYMIFLYYKTGDAYAFGHIQIAWDREAPSSPFVVLYNGLVDANYVNFYSSIATFIGIIIAIYILYKKMYAEFALLFLSILIPLSTGVMSMPRFIFTMFPIYLALSLITQNRYLLKIYILLFFSAALSFMSISWVSIKSFMV